MGLVFQTFSFAVVAFAQCLTIAHNVTNLIEPIDVSPNYFAILKSIN